MTKEIKIYKFNWLSEENKSDLITEYINQIILFTDFTEINKNSNLYKAYKKSNEMKTPWFLGCYIWDFCQKQIIRDLKQFCYFVVNNEHSKDDILQHIYINYYDNGILKIDYKIVYEK